jgi:hypothetical protein
MRINIAALRGFCPGTPKDAELPGTALLVEGDETVLTFTKRDAYAGWTTDDTKIITDEGETTIGEENVRRMQQMLGQWLRGEEVDI